MDLTGTETLEALIGSVPGAGSNTLILTKAALHGFLDRYERGELSRMDLFEITEFLNYSEHVVPDPCYESAIDDTLTTLSKYPLDEDPPLDVPILRYQLDHYRPYAPILGFEDLGTLRAMLSHVQRPTACVTKRTCVLWLERLGDGDLTGEELAEMAHLVLTHEPLEMEPKLRELVNELATPGRTKEMMLTMVRKLDQN